MIEARIHNNSIQVVCNKEVARLLQKEFSCELPGARFSVRVQSGYSDGMHKFYTITPLKNKDLLFEFSLGFKNRLEKFVKIEDSYQFEKQEILDFLKKEIPKLPFKIRKYQVKMIFGMLQNRIHLGILSTGGGKSLVAYLVLKFLLEKNQKTILIVPTINLVDQMFSDFKEYNATDSFLGKIQKIGGDNTDKNLGKPIIISTWQSLSNAKHSQIETYDCLFVDEAHKAKAEVLHDLLKLNVNKKIGQTGSMPIIKYDSMLLEEIFGTPNLYANAKTLIDLGLLTKTTIIALFLNYPRKDTKSKWKYQEEAKFIREYKPRLKYVINLINKVSSKGVTVATFNTTKFGTSIYEKLTGVKLSRIKNNFERQKAQGVFFVNGNTKPELREQIRKYLKSEESTNEVLIAQTETMSTGINIPKLKNFIFIEFPGKSFTLILQSIGRVMRKAKESGDNVYVWDLVDCFDYVDENYTLQHFWKRLEYYELEEHPIVEKEIQL